MAIGVDGVTGYGRSIMRGAMRFANMQRRWLIHEEMRHINDESPSRWPECDGSILAGVAPHLIQLAIERSRFVVRCSGSADPAITPVVSLDDVAVGRTAAEHLVECQLQHFGFVTHMMPDKLPSDRWRGFRETIEARGFTATMCDIHAPAGSTAAQIDATTQKLIQWLQDLPKPVGILAVDDVGAHRVAAACLEAKISVPDRVAIVGVNNDDLLCDSAWPPLSSVNGDYSRVGYAAASLLQRMLDGEKIKGDERHIRLPPLGVVRRMSTDVLAVDDPDLAEALRYIREHACDPCSVGDLIRHVPVARRWLERQFVKKIGRTPHDEIMRVRIDVAKRLLLEPGLTLSDVSARCGFSVVQNFGRAFLQATGMTPASMRRASCVGRV